MHRTPSLILSHCFFSPLPSSQITQVDKATGFIKVSRKALLDAKASVPDLIRPLGKNVHFFSPKKRLFISLRSKSEVAFDPYVMFVV